MNPEEARNVLWLRSNPRPLGKLLEEGYLTKDRLEWAAQWAYSSKLQQAAKILLDSEKPIEHVLEKQNVSNTSIQSPLEIGMRLDQACATKWPFSPYKGQPMGVLVQSQQLSIKDLGYAIDNAYDEKVRQAAVTLTLVRLERIVKEPAPSAGLVKIISGGRSYSEKKQSWLNLLEGMVLGILLAFGIFAIIMIFVSSNRPYSNTGAAVSTLLSTPTGIIALILVLGFLALFTWLIYFIPDQITKRLDSQIELFRFGEEGEERTVQMIIQALDGNWSLFRNVTLPGRSKGDLDIVLVGPPGVWVLEVKNLRGDYRNIGETWEYQQGKNWKSASANPGRQAKKNAGHLAEFLRADHLDTWVNPAVIWANEASPLFVENPSTAVWLFNRVPDELGNIWQQEKLSEEERKKIAEKLNKLCEAQRKDQ
jgi:hypothetical protein